MELRAKKINEQKAEIEKLKLENHFYEMLTATVSHDMRTPLNSILGLLGNIRSSLSDPRSLKLL